MSETPQEVTLTVTAEPSGSEAPAAEAAELAITLAEGQAALAIQQAAAIVADHHEDVVALEEQDDQQDRSIEALWRAVEESRTELSLIRETLVSLTSTPLPSLTEAEAETLETVAEELTETGPETILSLTPQSTSEEIASTPTEPSAGSASSEPVAEVVGGRRLVIL